MWNKRVEQRREANFARSKECCWVGSFTLIQSASMIPQTHSGFRIVDQAAEVSCCLSTRLSLRESSLLWLPTARSGWSSHLHQHPPNAAGWGCFCAPGVISNPSTIINIFQPNTKKDKMRWENYAKPDLERPLFHKKKKKTELKFLLTFVFSR